VKVTVLIPAFNEEKNIEQTLKGLDDFKNIYCRQNQIDLDILVIDDGSGDQTCINASKAGARVLGLKKNKGKGNALRAGLKNVDGGYCHFSGCRSSRKLRRGL